MKFNPAQQAAIRAKKNAVILAGAGSGKTTVLAERFLCLIEEKKVAIDQVLCLTFTKKAAAEMYERIYARLQLSESEHARQQLQRFDRARISTIDSFCVQVVRNWSARFGLPGDFIFEETVEQAEQAALDFIINHSGQAALDQLISLLGFGTTVYDLFASLARSYFNLAETYNLQQMLAGQLGVLQAELLACSREFNRQRELILELGSSGKAVSVVQAALQSLPDPVPLADNRDYSGLAALLAAVNLKKPGGKASPVIQQLKDSIDVIRGQTELASSILATLQHRELLAGVMELLEEFQQYYNDLKRSSKFVSFSDVAAMAVVTLLENKPLRSYYKKKYRYIMIDEFQDNNRQQKNLLFLLAEQAGLSLERIPLAAELEGDKLFFVGDDKQSIYRFRGADVSVFKDLSRELTGKDRSVISLDFNYRSAPGLLTFCNALFASLLAGATENYEASFQALAPPPGKQGIVPRIVFLYKPYDREQRESEYSNDESEAYAVARYIKAAVQQQTLLVEKAGHHVPAVYDDFTILMRSTSNQIIYEKMFRLFEIPYSCQSVRSLFLEAPVNDIYNLLQLVVYPWDRTAYAAYLRSPLVNVSDNTLLTLLAAGKPPFSEQIKMAPLERQKWEAGRQLYQELRGMADRCSLYGLVSFIWYNSGYRYYILQSSKFHNYLEYYDYLAALAGQFDAREQGLAAFLDYIRENLGKYEKLAELEILKQQVSGVQLMTIHKAKGLEFEIVVLANTGNRGRHAGSKAPYWVSDKYGLSLNLGEKNWFQTQAEAEAGKKEQAELKRLLYVALTRAKSHIIISGVHNSQNLHTEKAQLNLLLNHFNFFPKAEDPGSQDYQLESVIIEDLAQADYQAQFKATRKPDLKQVKEIYQQARVICRSYPQCDFSVTELNAVYCESLRKPAFVTFPPLEADRYLQTAEQHKQFGKLCHYLLEQQFKGEFNPAAIPLHLQSSFSPDQYPLIEQAALQLAGNFTNSGLGKAASQAEVVETEFPFLYRFTYEAKAYFLRGVIDLYFEAGDQAVVVDFKTDLSLAKDHYLLQLGIYALAVRQLTGKQVSCWLFPLRSREPLSLTEAIKPEFITAQLAGILTNNTEKSA